MGNITDDLSLSKEVVSSILRKELEVIGTWNSNFSNQYDDWKDALPFISDGIQPSQLVTQWITLDELPVTLKKLYDHKMGGACFESIKVMIHNIN